MVGALQLFQLPLAGSCSSSTVFKNERLCKCCGVTNHGFRFSLKRRRRGAQLLVYANKENTELLVSSSSANTNSDVGITQQQEEEEEEEDAEQKEETEEKEEEEEPTPEDLENVNQIKRVLELLRSNRDMLFSEVRLTIMIEDPREVERRRLLGIDDADAPTREDLVAALDEVNEGKVPKDRVALRMLAEEMNNWPNLEADAPKKKPSKSLYAKATDTGINPRKAAQRLNIDWDSAAEIEEADENDETEVPPAVGYGALYLVTAFPIIIGISVVLILFYNSLQ